MPEDSSAFRLPETVPQLVGTKQAFLGKARETLHWGWADSTFKTLLTFHMLPSESLHLLHFLCWNKPQRCFFAHCTLILCQEMEQQTPELNNSPTNFSQTLHQQDGGCCFPPGTECITPQEEQHMSQRGQPQAFSPHFDPEENRRRRAQPPVPSRESARLPQEPSAGIPVKRSMQIKRLLHQLT